MTAKACSEWGGLFSVGDELDDEDLLEADWTHTPASRPPVVPGSTPLKESTKTCSHNAEQGPVALAASLRDSFSAPNFAKPELRLPQSSPVKALRSIGRNLSSVSHSDPHVAHSSLRAPLGSSTLLHSETAQSKRPPPVCAVPQKESLQDDFDDWDVDLEELDECVHLKTSASVRNFPSDDTSPTKRLKLSRAGQTNPVPHTTVTPRPPESFVRSPSSNTFTPRANLQPGVPPSCRFSSPLTPRPVRPSAQWQRGPVTPGVEPRPTGSLFQAISPAPSPTHRPRPLQMPVLTNHLVQLVSAANKTPQRPRSDAVRSKTRRFPGPAGALPQQVTGHSLDDIVVKVPQTPAHGAVARQRSEVPSSAVSEEDEFSGGAWAAMKAEMGLDERNPACFLHSYSTVMVLRKAALRQLPKNKVPNMAVVLKSIVHTHADAKAVFRDPTGEIQGTVHRRLLEDRQEELKPGAVLLLKQVGVFSPSYRNHYLNVTPNNLLRIYPPDGTVYSSSQHSQSSLGLGLLACTPPGVEGGPVCQMELHFDDDAEEEQSTVSDIPAPPGSNVAQHSLGQEHSEDAQWGTDDLDELLGELPVESYTA
ncbi:homologous recombination OB-fold protein [Trichomycterus rosablanca]|uniref:homologous recombination OB-fold protein n=1 Tax=Trichomycterus rosablanca TaxID=2290929 RepID=UPI002F35B8EB